jgi:transketolase|tara:strand:+ start:407 stop:1234 length:828 start_codon:yes stop_codon:yes gene_type:complete
MKKKLGQNFEKIKKFSIKMRKDILNMALKAGVKSSHFGGALSIVEVISVLFNSKINFNKDPSWENRDRFILSKGHACLAYYSALNQIGYLNKNDLETFESNESNLMGHPVLNKKIGIDYSTGSLGMGLSIGIGTCIAAKKRNKKFKTYVIIGDGECNEGSIWESAMSASHLKLDNLIVILDNNGFQQTGKNQEIMNLKNLSSKWKSFGWEVETVDGHDIKKLTKVFKENKENKPKIIIAKTIKGKGFSFSENNNSWHHSVLTKSNYDKALKELKY